MSNTTQLSSIMNARLSSMYFGKNFNEKMNEALGKGEGRFVIEYTPLIVSIDFERLSYSIYTKKKALVISGGDDETTFSELVYNFTSDLEEELIKIHA